MPDGTRCEASGTSSSVPPPPFSGEVRRKRDGVSVRVGEEGVWAARHRPWGAPP